MNNVSRCEDAYLYNVALMTNREAWEHSAGPWVEYMDRGDPHRIELLDPLLVGLVKEFQPHGKALDIGCGEGRFSRILSSLGYQTVGIDFSKTIIASARARGQENYVLGDALSLPLRACAFGLTILYLVLLDVEDLKSALAEATRVTESGGVMIVCNLNAFITSSGGWIKDGEGLKLHYPVDNYMEERSSWFSWEGVTVMNWHRPLSSFMTLMLQMGLVLRKFIEPAPESAMHNPKLDVHVRAPYFLVTVWQKP